MKSFLLKCIFFLGLKPFSFKRILILCVPFVALATILIYELSISLVYVRKISSITHSLNKLNLEVCSIENQYLCLKNKVSKIPAGSHIAGAMFLAKATKVALNNINIPNEVKIRDLVNVSLDVVEYIDLNNSFLNKFYTFSPIGTAQVCLLKKNEKDLASSFYTKLETTLYKKISKFELKSDSNIDWKLLRKRSEDVFREARDNNDKLFSVREREKCKYAISWLENSDTKSSKTEKMAISKDQNEN